MQRQCPNSSKQSLDIFTWIWYRKTDRHHLNIPQLNFWIQETTKENCFGKNTCTSLGYQRNFIWQNNNNNYIALCYLFIFWGVKKLCIIFILVLLVTLATLKTHSFNNNRPFVLIATWNAHCLLSTNIYIIFCLVLSNIKILHYAYMSLCHTVSYTIWQANCLTVKKLSTEINSIVIFSYGNSY